MSSLFRILCFSLAILAAVFTLIDDSVAQVRPTAASGVSRGALVRMPPPPWLMESDLGEFLVNTNRQMSISVVRVERMTPIVTGEENHVGLKLSDAQDVEIADREQLLNLMQGMLNGSEPFHVVINPFLGYDHAPSLGVFTRTSILPPVEFQTAISQKSRVCECSMPEKSIGIHCIGDDGLVTSPDFVSEITVPAFAVKDIITCTDKDVASVRCADSVAACRFVLDYVLTDAEKQAAKKCDTKKAAAGGDVGEHIPGNSVSCENGTVAPPPVALP